MNSPRGQYIKPLDSTGAPLTNELRRGEYTLTAGQTYFYIMDGAGSPFLSVHISSPDATLVITSATIQDCNHSSDEVSNFSAVVGEWVTEDPTTAFVGADGTGWSASNGIGAALGTGAGGALFHIAESGAARTRLAVLVGGTGGRLRVSGHGKE